jgi:chemotaxis protein methyltransferase CheR
VLEQARDARYGAFSTAEMTPALQRYLVPLSGGASGVCTEIRRSVEFCQHNLVDPAPGLPSAWGQGPGSWDFVVCRNVLMYLCRQAATTALSEFRDSLLPRGWIFLGAVEVVDPCPPGLVEVGISGRKALRLRVDAP